MKTLNYLDLNSGETRKSYRSELDPTLIFTLTGFYKDSLNPDGVNANICGETFNIHTTLTSNGGLTTLCAFVGNTTFPILSTGYSDVSLDVYYQLYDACKEIDTLKHNRNKPCQLPYYCDASLPLGRMVLGSLSWRNDFSYCMAWCGIEELKRRRSDTKIPFSQMH